MKILSVLYYLIQWSIWVVALLTWTQSDLPIKSMPIKVIILILLALYLIWIGKRDFIKSTKNN
jgi:hypothetical protein